MSVAYQGVEIGKGSNAVYKVGSKGQQYASDGSSTTYKLPVPNQNDSALWNLLTFSMYIRSQSPESSNCCSSLSPLQPLNSSGSLRPDAGDKSPSSPLYSNLGSLGEADHEANSSDEEVALGGRGESQCWSVSNCSTDTLSSHDGEYEKKSKCFHFSPNPALTEGARLVPGSSGFMYHNDNGPELSTSSSSIGNRSDDSSGSVESNVEVSGDMEVESRLRSGPLDLMSNLEDSLPIKRGLSRFWNGKSKSFTSLADVSSVTDLAKPENPFNKRRRFSTFGDRHRSFPPLSRSSTGGISKKPPSGSGRSCLAVAVAMGSKLETAPHRASPSPSLPSAGRSFSLTDLRHASEAGSPAPPMRMRRA